MSDPAPPLAEGTPAAVDPYSRLVWFILLTGTALRIYLLFSTHATEEDFYITLRYAENIAAGHGFVYNIGQHVLGTTTPLYTLVLAFIARAGLDPILFGKLLGIGADLFAGLFTYRLGRALGRPLAGLAAVLCICFAPTNLVWSGKGMEVGIVAAAAVGAWAAWVEKRETVAWICAAVLVLLRIDGAALALVMLGATVLRDRRIPWWGLAIFTALIVPWAVFATAYFGSPIPLSLGAKLTVYGRLIPGHFPQLGPFVILMLHNPIGLVSAGGCLLFIVIACGLRRSTSSLLNPSITRPELALAAPLLWIGLYYAGMALSHVVLFGWYFVPPAPIFYLAGMVGISMAAERIGLSEARAQYKIVATAAVVAVTIAVNVVGPRMARTLRDSQAVETDLRIPIGEWIHNHARPDETLMLEPIGYIGYYSGLKVIDVVGLVSPEALPSYAPSIVCPDHDMWQRLHPDLLLLRAGQLKRLNAYEATLPEDQRLAAAYFQFNSWKDPLNPGGPAAFVLYRRLGIRE